ncbi:type IV pilin N-terminal domain-containing protein [Haloferax larsenii]|uniref:Type IV pilin N-terminal domain-containing protein n=1 Tax=Haloferax larsenii TaxID=302484 RepID=A0ABY5REK1_HALLR|nr:type IV pilin N-terminal domain-containing protein [Haloferax larsenii]UVE50485.1 type IV pilin N-terminal domain-containing protein [Haloferax larsenii]
MKLQKFLTDDNAVSPVIGVILMVAITVILAAVIGTFVLGLGEQTETAPQASFSFDYNESGGTNGLLTITHESGEAIANESVTVVPPNGTSQNWLDSDDNKITAGDNHQVDFTNQINDSESVRIVWTSESGGTSSTLQKWTYDA